jgi:hypothetical protein
MTLETELRPKLLCKDLPVVVLMSPTTKEKFLRSLITMVCVTIPPH